MVVWLLLFMELHFVSTKVQLMFTGSVVVQIGNVSKTRSMPQSKRQKMRFQSSTKIRQRTGKLLTNGFVEWTHNGDQHGRHSSILSAPLWWPTHLRLLTSSTCIGENTPTFKASFIRVTPMTFKWSFTTEALDLRN
jgi:hypothetical protein